MKNCKIMKKENRMREIKFRAWDNEKREFLSDDYGPISVGDSKVVTDGDWQGVYYTDKYTIEQYTGLKDKNGKEIYEGDIVEYTTHYYSKEKRHRKVVEWEEWDSDGFGEPHNLGYFNLSEYMTVIGNIHENPELLEGEKDD